MMRARILVVDDEPGMIRVVERVLGRDHDVAGTGSPIEAVAMADGFAPDLALLDIRMPELTGFELMARLKAAHPAMDIILMTGSVDDFDEKLIRAIRSRAFYFIQKPFDREVLVALVNRCLELRWRRDESRRQLDRLERELREAHAFQLSLLPPPAMRIGTAALDCRYQPTAQLGGDLYDYVPAGDGVAVIVADVSGHGVSAAMLTGVVKSAFRGAQVDAYDPLAVVRRLSDGLTAFRADRFVTVFTAVLLPAAGVMRYVNAGHPDGLVRAADGGVVRLGSSGPLVSPALGRLRWETRETPLAHGDRVLLYTDGVSESLSEDDGIGHLAAMLSRSGGGVAGSALLDGILASVSKAHGDAGPPDDVTLLTALVSRA